MQCEQVQDRLPGFADDERPGRRTRAHLSRCLRCQAELARYRRLRRACAHLTDTPVTVPADLVERVLERLDHVPRARRVRQVASIGGIAVTAAAGAVGAVVLTRRHQA
jgi:hypothetical protein